MVCIFVKFYYLVCLSYELKTYTGVLVGGVLDRKDSLGVFIGY